MLGLSLSRSSDRSPFTASHSSHSNSNFMNESKWRREDEGTDPPRHFPEKRCRLDEENEADLVQKHTGTGKTFPPHGNTDHSNFQAISLSDFAFIIIEE